MPETILETYDTIESPQPFIEEKKTQFGLTSTIGMLTIPRERLVKRNYILQANLVAEVRLETNKYVVVDYQIDEYGIGDSREEAEQDLLDSLVDYLASLERREKRLGEKESQNLQILRSILKR